MSPEHDAASLASSTAATIRITWTDKPLSMKRVSALTYADMLDRWALASDRADAPARVAEAVESAKAQGFLE